MSRVNFNDMTEVKAEESTNELDLLIPQYAENKTELDSYKKLCDDENKRIKDLMSEQDLKSYVAGNYKVTRTVTKRESFNEEQLLNFINTVLWADKGSMTCPYTKIKYVVDYDALEKAIYNGEISKEMLLEMDKCKEVKEVVTLRLSKNKKGEN